MPTSSPDIRNRVALQPKTNARFQAFDHGKDQIGRGISQFGAGINDVAEDLEVIAQVHDEAAVKEVEIQAIEAANTYTREATGAKGKNALVALEDSDGRLKSIYEEGSQKLTSQRQKDMFKTIFDQRAISYRDKLETHRTAETLSYALETSVARSASIVDTFAGEEDEAEAEVLIETLRSETATGLALAGTPDAKAGLLLKEALSTARIARAETLSVDDPQAARDYVAQHSGEMTSEHVNKFQSGIRVRADKAVAQSSFEELLQGAKDAPPADGEAEPVEADPDKRDAALSTYADPMRGRGSTNSAAQRFNAKRDGGKRVHGALDIGAAEGTAVYPGYDGGGTVIEVDDVGRTSAGKYIKVKHNDGTVTSYSHLRNVSVTNGTAVNGNTVMGGVGGTGVGGKKSYRPHLHYKVRDPGDNLVDPEKYTAKAKYTPQYDGEDVNIDALYTKAKVMAEEKGWTGEQYEALLDQVDAYARRQDAVRERRYGQAADVAAQAEADIYAAGGSLTDADAQIPNLKDLSPQKQAAYRKTAQNNLKVQNNAAKALGVAVSKENYWTLIALSQDTSINPDTGRTWREDFAQSNLQAYAGVLTAPQMATLRSKQSAVINGDAPSVSKVRTAVARFYPEANVGKKGSEDRKKATYLIEKATARLEVEQKKEGRTFTEIEIQDKIVKPMLAEHFRWEDGYFTDGYDNDDPVAAYEVQGGFVEGETIPAAEYRKIHTALKRQNPGRSIGEDEIREVYLAARKR